ncbi:ribosome recycling factor [Gulosibacter sp. 10]|uniref:ribosome recycling factor n=1 Tax=Gulosibacter sp. 10 TaxID=1255570 RepID=UPI00097F14E2|nr:ribosome recycling factor [Gulosibacter sp. 10]SJM52206.1 Ribosome recycling factor [Gulosibacter sp. 10]
MISEVIADTKDKMEKAVEHAHEEFGNIRTGRANPALFDRLNVEYYGTPTPLGQLASLQQPEARMLVITPYDKSALKEIEKTIVSHPNLGVTPTNDGSLIRVVMPELTKERRQEYVKLARDKAEDARIAVRNIRRKSKSDLEALKDEIGEDDIARGEKELDKITKSFVDRIDEALKAKEADLLEV